MVDKTKVKPVTSCFELIQISLQSALYVHLILSNPKIYFYDTVDYIDLFRDLADALNKTPGCVDSKHLPDYAQNKDFRAEVI